ncbi:MAG: hypothetical protein KJ941_02550 [Bacteroidetes bacterium]|nr:hypothetical protein [Bacteroidota bacterium]
MPYSVLKAEVASRFLEVGHLLNSIKSIEDSHSAPAIPPVEYRILKGLFYVHLYACIEFSINKSVIHTLTLIKSRNVRYQHFENKFYTVALFSNVQSVRDCKSKSILDKSADLFNNTESMDISKFDETLLSQYLQNIWGKSFNQITKTLGASTFSIAPRDYKIFDEIVENRNKVAHGRDSAVNIGSSPTYSDLKSKFDTVIDVINRYIYHLETFYSNKEFILTSERVNY